MESFNELMMRRRSSRKFTAEPIAPDQVQELLKAALVAPDCMTADAYATAFMAMGLEAACRMAESVPEIAYYVIYTDEAGVHRVKMSPKLEEMIVGKAKNEK